MDKRILKIFLVAAALSVTGCAVADTAPSEFSFDRITISNPLQPRDEK